MIVNSKAKFSVHIVPIARLATFVTALALFACSTPTLVEIARRGQAGATGTGVKDDVTVQYHVTDRDVLNFTDEVKRKLANRSTFHMSVRYGSATAQATLGALAGAAKVIGWGVSTASGLGLGATYIFGLGQIFDAKTHALAYEQAFTAIQSAEAAFYFHQTGMRFIEKPAGSGKFVVDYLTRDRSERPRYSTVGPSHARRRDALLQVRQEP